MPNRLLVSIAIFGVALSGEVRAQRQEASSPPSQPHGLPAPAPAGVAKYAVLIDLRREEDSKRMSANGVLLEGGLVATAAHCLEDAVEATVNLGALGVAAIKSVEMFDEDRDLAVLQVELPEGVTGGLKVRRDRPPSQEVITMLARDQIGTEQFRAGMPLGVEMRGDIETLSTTIPAWLGASGSGVVDAEGRLVGLLTRLNRESKDGDFTQARHLLSRKEKPIEWRQWLFRQSMKSRGRVVTYVNWGRYYLERSLPEQAFIEYKKALIWNPNDRHAISGCVWCKKEQGGEQAACEWISEYVRENPTASNAGVVMAHSFLRAGDTAKAIAQYSKLIDAEPTVMTLYWRANAHSRNNAYEKALQDYERALTIDPENEAVLVAAQEVAEKNKDFQSCLAYSRRLLTLVPNELEFAKQAAVHAAMVGEPGEAERIERELRAKSPFAANQVQISLKQIKPATSRGVDDRGRDDVPQEQHATSK